MNAMAGLLEGSGGMHPSARWDWAACLAPKYKTPPEARRLIRRGVDVNNVASGRPEVKNAPADYLAVERVLAEAWERIARRTREASRAIPSRGAFVIYDSISYRSRRCDGG